MKRVLFYGNAIAVVEGKKHKGKLSLRGDGFAFVAKGFTQERQFQDMRKVSVNFLTVDIPGVFGGKHKSAFSISDGSEVSAAFVTSGVKADEAVKPLLGFIADERMRIAKEELARRKNEGRMKSDEREQIENTPSAAQRKHGQVDKKEEKSEDKAKVKPEKEQESPLRQEMTKKEQVPLSNESDAWEKTLEPAKRKSDPARRAAANQGNAERKTVEQKVLPLNGGQQSAAAKESENPALELLMAKRKAAALKRRLQEKESAFEHAKTESEAEKQKLREEAERAKEAFTTLKKQTEEAKAQLLDKQKDLEEKLGAAWAEAEKLKKKQNDMERKLKAEQLKLEESFAVAQKELEARQQEAWREFQAEKAAFAQKREELEAENAMLKKKQKKLMKQWEAEKMKAAEGEKTDRAKE